jgi:hypothetical protein
MAGTSSEASTPQPRNDVLWQWSDFAACGLALAAGRS